MNASALLVVRSRLFLLLAAIVVMAEPLLRADYSDISVTGSTVGGGVWGSSPYTSDSDLAKAAVHAGLLTPGQTKMLRVTYLGPQSSFTGSTQNGVTTWSYGFWPDSYALSLAAADHAPSVSLSFDSTSWLNGSTRQAGTATSMNAHVSANDSDGDLFGYRIYWSDGTQTNFLPGSPTWPSGSMTRTMPSNPVTLQVRADAWDVAYRYAETPWYTIQVVTPPSNQAPVASVWGPTSALQGEWITRYCAAADAEGQLLSWKRLYGQTSGSYFYTYQSYEAAIAGAYRFEAFDEYVYSPELKLEARDIHGQVGTAVHALTLVPAMASPLTYTASHGRVNADGSEQPLGAVPTQYLTDWSQTNNEGYWSGFAYPTKPWLLADLGAAKRVLSVGIGTGNVSNQPGYYYCAGAKLQWSTGNGVWTTIFTVPYAPAFNVFTVSVDQVARYWRLIRDNELVTTELQLGGTTATAPTGLGVVQGSGGGPGAADTVFNLTADAPLAGQLFAGWVIESGAGAFSSPATPLTQFTLGAGSAVVRATYTPNLAPTAVIEGPSSVRVGLEGVWTYTAGDANGNLLNWSMRLLPAAPNPTSISGSAQTSAFAHTFSTPGTYTFRFEVTDALGITTTADKAVTALENTPPSVPGSVSATALSPTHFQLTWAASNDASGISGYEVCLNDGIITAASGLAHLFEGLPHGSSHVAKVRAIDGAGNVSNWAQASVTLPANASGDTQAPTAPTLDVWGSDTTSNLLFGGSTDNVGVTQYELRRDVQPVEVFNAQGGSIFHLVTGLANGTTYTFKVRAVDAAGNRSGWTSVPWTTSGSPPPPPSGAVTSSDYTVLGASPGAPADSSNASQLKTTRPKP